MKIIFCTLLIFLLCVNIYAQKDCALIRPNYTPLPDLVGQQFRGYSGGLYSNGSNIPPEKHSNAINNILLEIFPRSFNGLPDNNGKIVIIGVGASNPRTEFNEFIRNYYLYPERNPSLALVNTCIGGQGIQKMNQQTDNYWKQAKKIIEDSNYSVNQVQIAWIETDNTQQADTSFPRSPLSLAKEYHQLLVTLRKEFPQLKLCYLSARGYAGWVSDNQTVGRGLLFPRDYYNGWAIRFLLDSIITNQGEYVYSGLDAKIPLATWGSYLWTNGEKPRNDGFTLDCETDIGPDGLHLTVAGEKKMGHHIFEMFKANNSASSWFSGNTSTLVNEQQSEITPTVHYYQSSEQLYIPMHNCHSSDLTLKVYSHYGDEVFSETLAASHFDVSFLSNGLYYCILQDGNAVFRYPFVIVR